MVFAPQHFPQASCPPNHEHSSISTFGPGPARSAPLYRRNSPSSSSSGYARNMSHRESATVRQFVTTPNAAAGDFSRRRSTHDAPLLTKSDKTTNSVLVKFPGSKSYTQPCKLCPEGVYSKPVPRCRMKYCEKHFCMCKPHTDLVKSSLRDRPAASVAPEPPSSSSPVPSPPSHAPALPSFSEGAPDVLMSDNVRPDGTIFSATICY